MLATCRSIVKSVVDMGVEDQDRWLTWEGDAADATRKGAFETARAIYAHALSVFPGDEEIWRAAASMEKQHGTREGLDALLKKAVTYCPQVGQQHVLYSAGSRSGHLWACCTLCTPQLEGR